MTFVCSVLQLTQHVFLVRFLCKYAFLESDLRGIYLTHVFEFLFLLFSLTTTKCNVRALTQTTREVICANFARCDDVYFHWRLMAFAYQHAHFV